MNRLYSLETSDSIDDSSFVLEYQKDILATHYLAPLSTVYLPWTGYSMRPSGLVQVLSEVWVKRCQVIVECGSGISTFYIARLLKSRGGHLYSIENNSQWLDLVKNGLAQEGLGDLVTFIDAPLQPTALALDNLLWYDSEAIASALPSSQKIDLLLVDGPPAYELNIQYSRYPAVPYFLPQLSPECTIVLDDATRPGEQRILQKWEELLRREFEVRDGDIAMIRS